MSLDNLISVSLSDDEQKKINDALGIIEQTLRDKLVNLTPEERQLYGKLGNRTENWVRKVKAYMDQRPELVPFYLDKAEHERDLDARDAIIPIMNRMESIVEGLDDTAKLLGTDIYNASLAYYRNIKLISQQNVAGTTNIYKDLATQFPGRSSHILEEGNALPLNNSNQENT